ncbi:2Fe-2S iron-sulfur cluster-binding protein [Actinoplanes teichomyceticus]|uniref:2Fe-2S iron-sulfur cluster protein n=1 Tax=Actinoplanes teichomyceticus TaxID=1867 RepID=A0A561WM14_ACTTI|nr:2Fe-2S iron-sulfur cluster-binding protein [Actinoplanes teichomyceticus]TWG24883.1 2Fe-2S iron-sulfur cluster protein [Actinoplanes teichomyceticus]
MSLSVDGADRELDLAPDRTLVAVLREDCGRTGVQHGCADGTCGACTVRVDGEALRSCLMLAVQCHGAHVDTVAA